MGKDFRLAKSIANHSKAAIDQFIIKCGSGNG